LSRYRRKLVDVDVHLDVAPVGAPAIHAAKLIYYSVICIDTAVYKYHR